MNCGFFYTQYTVTWNVRYDVCDMVELRKLWASNFSNDVISCKVVGERIIFCKERWNTEIQNRTVRV